mmetsp:Transcript_27791/g.64365  ORF Transcript_27791/g.64365 Transcript_27791/m.64365 type:complete len:199 (+) Transcript_27791:709-1305(+)
MEALAHVAKIQQDIHAHTYMDDDNFEVCITLDWNATLEYFATPHKSMAGGTRSWLWQTCTEFGYYQTCPEDSMCPFGRGFHTLDADLSICEVAFGLNETQVRTNVEATQAWYAPQKTLDVTTRILSLQGDVDPWSVLTNDDTVQNVHWVVGASHHFWTHPSKPTDTREVQEARHYLYTQIIEWFLPQEGSIASQEEKG